MKRLTNFLSIIQGKKNFMATFVVNNTLISWWFIWWGRGEIDTGWYVNIWLLLLPAQVFFIVNHSIYNSSKKSSNNSWCWLGSFPFIFVYFCQLTSLAEFRKDKSLQSLCFFQGGVYTHCFVFEKWRRETCQVVFSLILK